MLVTPSGITTSLFEPLYFTKTPFCIMNSSEISAEAEVGIIRNNKRIVTNIHRVIFFLHDIPLHSLLCNELLMISFDKQGLETASVF